LTDRSFWGTLRKGWVRHGIVEIIKMSVVKDLRLFELLEKAGPKLVATKFGTTPEAQEDEEFMQMCDEIVGLAMLGYVRSEYGNLWETHQCRPHAYGHTWSPGYELPAGMLHGHAVATCMGFGAYLSCRKMQWISESQMMRVLNVISSMELALWHPIMDDHETIYGSQKKMTDKRGGNLAAPVPRGTIGECGYINDMEESELSFRLDEYKALVQRHFPGERGTGVEVHCSDVGLQDPSTVIPAPAADAKPVADEGKVELSYCKENPLLVYEAVEKDVCDEGRQRVREPVQKNDPGDEKVKPKAFPLDLSAYAPPALDPWASSSLPASLRPVMESNVQLCRDAIVTFTACAAAAGYGGHTGGAFDMIPEVTILDAMFQTCPDKFVPIMFDEAGHRVATQYLWLALRGTIDPAHLQNYRKGHEKLPGHPEMETPGIEFASGRLGHMWPYCNGVCLGNPGKAVVCFGSDGSQMEGNDAEAARFAVSQNLNIKVIVDDNDVTIAGKPSQYLKGYSVAQTLRGHGMTVLEVNGEDIADIYQQVQAAVVMEGPVAVVIHREMAPGIPELEGTPQGHDVISVAKAVEYLQARGHTEAIEYIKSVPKAVAAPQKEFKGAGPVASLRMGVVDAMVKELGKLSPDERKARCIAIDSDLEGSTGLCQIRKAFPEMFVKSGIMERGNFSACAGFGREEGKQGIFSTFCAFLEMVVSEITMARLNQSNVLCHFSHTGVDEMADNTCHFGLNVFFADNGLQEHGTTPLYFPADGKQVEKVVEQIFWDKGLRFIFSLRSKVPELRRADGSPYYTDAYNFVPGKDEILVEGTAGYVVAVGDAVYRANDAVLRLREAGVMVGLVNKPTLNVLDEAATKKVGRSPFVLVVEPLNKSNSLGVHYGYWLTKLGLSPVYEHIGAHRNGCGGLHEHAYHQGYDSQSIQTAVKRLVSMTSAAYCAQLAGER
jgi:transketolase